MKTNLQFDFIVDKANSQLTLKREFLATRQLVWDCYTKSELLDRWFAPKPMTTKTKDMGEKTLCKTVVKYNSLADLETVVQMGMEQGMKLTLEKLDELLAMLTR
jgi:uncharacterized protein YndB with AHSA1/START domain